MNKENTKLHQLQQHYNQFDKGNTTASEFKQSLTNDLKIRWNPQLETVINRMDHSYTSVLRGIYKTNKYVPANTQPIEQPLPVPNKVRSEHIGHANLLKWDQ